VVIHAKYPHHLRVQAALSLIRMKPRKGQHVGLHRLVDQTLAELAPEPRAKILADLIPLIIEELKKPPPKATQGGQASPDPSFKYKDASYLMLTYEKTQLISDQALKKELMAALTEWAMADFDRRLQERGQAYGMDQLLRRIGPSSVVKLPSLMQKGSRNLAKMADIISKIGSKETKEEAAVKLVEIVKYVASEQWRKDKLPELKEANRKSGFDPTEAQLNKQLAKFQTESVARVFASMKKVGGKSMVEHCLTVAADKDQPKEHRQTALAALEGHLDRRNESQIDALFAIVKSDPPDVVIDQAFRRIRDMPRSVVKDKLYAFFESDSWKLRRLAGATLLQMSTVKHADEFLKQLGDKATTNFNLAEAITFGAYLAALKDGDPLEAIAGYMKQGKTPARLAALSYYYEKGDKTMLDQLKPFEGDQQAIPECEEDGKCDWTCVVGTGKSKETKEAKTVGDFVTYCIRPKMEQTEPAKKTPAKGDKEKKGDDKDAPGKPK
jgi:hypothetical protein